ncbi:MAG TPA: S8 family serine peptidase [Verrucomicrobiae bacterium]|nr:S8 family serine peptidase [Verrucomicrobiae bacterium]
MPDFRRFAPTKPFHLIHALLVLVLGRATAQTPPPPAIPPAPMVTVNVVLAGESLSQMAAGDGAGFATASVAPRTKARAIALQAQHKAQQPRIEAAGGRVMAHFTRVLNAIRVRVPADKVNNLRALPGVVSVRPARIYQRNLSRAIPFIGTPGAWGTILPHVDGKDIRIGIIDSGIDYLHADFGGSGKVEDYNSNDRTVIEPGTFPTAKVKGGFDFAGDDYDADSVDHGIPIPDPDPLDCYGHGTHVAGIAAGFGVLNNGQTYTGEYSPDLDFSKFLVGPGVAPRASLYALKVFGCAGSTFLVTDALEWAADPNGDDDLSDRLDVVNLSLGSDFGGDDPEDSDIAAVNNLVSIGCVVVSSSGNSGSISYVTGSPAVASRAISVANTTVGRTDAIQVTAPASLATNYVSAEGGFTARLKTNGPVTGTLVYVEPHDLCGQIQNAEAVNGHIALIDRGTCFFVDKVQAAQDAGAIAVVMVNNTIGQPFAMGGDSTAITIPGVMVSQLDGDLFKAHLAEGITVSLDASLFFQSLALADNLDGDSSRGPAGLSGRLKPEISAPGTSITSAAFGTGTNGISMSGTSMASPFVAGAAALLRQLHPDWTVEDIKAALMNTSVGAHDTSFHPYPESWQGSGRVQVDKAAAAQVTVATENTGGNVAFSLGALVLNAPFTTNGLLRLTNHGADDVTFQISVKPTIPQAGVTLSVATNSITVPGNSFARLAVTFQATPSQFNLTNDPTTVTEVLGEAVNTLFEASGGIYFQQGSQSLHVPYYASLRAGANFHAVTNLIVLPPNTRSNTQTAVKVPMRGTGSNPGALLSVFELGTTLPDQHLHSPYDADANLLAVGVASDVVPSGSIADTTLYFGVAMAGFWPTPRSAFVQPKILIDTNADGTADFQLINGGSPVSDDELAAGDLFQVELDLLDPAGFVVGSLLGRYLNFYPADVADTAPFDNSVMVLPVQAADLGLTENQARFRYMVVSSGFTSGVSVTGWIPFDALHPIIDGSVTSDDGTNFHTDDGSPLDLMVDRAAAAQAGQRLPGLMILHHHNIPGERLDVVRLDLSDDDTDFDGLPDWWEFQYFKSLTATDGAGDADHDGVTDKQEFQAGTDPTQANSMLKILSAQAVDGQGITVSWTSAPGKSYALLRSTNLASGIHVPLATNLFATPPVNTFQDLNTDRSKTVFYRVQLQ